MRIEIRFAIQGKGNKRLKVCAQCFFVFIRFQQQTVTLTNNKRWKCEFCECIERGIEQHSEIIYHHHSSSLKGKINGKIKSFNVIDFFFHWIHFIWESKKSVSSKHQQNQNVFVMSMIFFSFHPHLSSCRGFLQSYSLNVMSTTFISFQIYFLPFILNINFELHTRKLSS